MLVDTVRLCSLAVTTQSMPLVEGVLAGVLATGATSGASVGYGAVRDWPQSDSPLADNFEDALAERIKERAEAIDSFALVKVFHHWDAITDEIDTADVLFDIEEDALDSQSRREKRRGIRTNHHLIVR